jgi:hypothetical protein
MDIDLRALLPVIIIGGSFTFTGVIIYGAWLLGRYRGRDERALAEAANLEARLDRLEQMVGATMDAVDRLEGGRLSAGLLREPSRSLRQPGKIITPH